MFFDYNVFDKKSDKAVCLKNAKKVIDFKTENTFIDEYLDEVCAKASDGDVKCAEIKLNIGISDEIKEKVASSQGKPYEYNEEGYVIDAGEVTNVYGETERAIIHAISTIKLLMNDGEFTECFIYDKPFIPRRGLHYFVPGRKRFDEFKSMVNDILVAYKYNYIMIEVGGAMEYKKHPKINEEWEKFATRMLSDSGVSDKLQHYTYPWAKNAIHAENGGGSYITQDEMRELIKYCNDRGIEVVPDLPTLGHADYIVRAYPELNERVDDHDPDTYCPSNPRTYEIVFDLIDEVLDVFKGTDYFSIGHDEVVTIGVCDKCKDKDPVDLFADDVTKLYNYLAEKGKKVIMWGDKFTKLYKNGMTCEEANGEPYIDRKGKLCGGLSAFPKDDVRHVPAIYPAIDKIPKDIIIGDWYWYFKNNFDHVFTGHDVVLSNFIGRAFVNWKKRINKTIKLVGASSSAWCRPDYKNMQRNGDIYDLIYNAYIGWSDTYDDPYRPGLFEKTKAELHSYYLNSILKVSPDKKYITVTHNTNHEIAYFWFVDGDFVKDENYYMGDYVVTYADGTTHKEPVLYGENISNENHNIHADTSALIEVSGTTSAIEVDGKTYYKWTFENPYGDKKIEDIKFVSSGKFEGAKVYTKEIVY